MTVYDYPAIRCRQTPMSAWVAFFSAPANHIAIWGGIPQKKELGTRETTGFQREVNPHRIKQLRSFYKDSRNVIQNPLLAAQRSQPSGKVEFIAHDTSNTYVQTGLVRIAAEPLGSLQLVEILRRVKAGLEHRMPELKQRTLDEVTLASLRQQAGLVLNPTPEPEDEDPESDKFPQTTADDDTALAAVVDDESHILDFWDELASRVRLLEELGDSAPSDSFLGYEKSALISYLKPVVIVDGQHRLEGASAAIEQQIDEQEDLQAKLAALVDAGVGPTEAHERVASEHAAHLPVSLLLSDDPAEHVFQFVIVNQKATPIGKPLLGTIISTTLSSTELRGVAERLQNAGIPLEDSRAIASLTRDRRSPFRGLVERGLTSESAADLLSWSVFGSLVRIFRDLEGGKLFGQKVDYADLWQRKYLESSELVKGWDSRGYEKASDYWREQSGPWREIFIQFWTKIRDLMGNAQDQEVANQWGDPRNSNLFNKISLTILSADFFQFLCERGNTINSPTHVSSLVDEWLTDVSRQYFNRDWKLQGVKKDSTGIRNQWAKIWVEYRKDPSRLPRVENYRLPLGGG